MTSVSIGDRVQAELFGGDSIIEGVVKRIDFPGEYNIAGSLNKKTLVWSDLWIYVKAEDPSYKGRALARDMCYVEIDKIVEVRNKNTFWNKSRRMLRFE